MVLNDEQCVRFFDTMDALLYYVNERFRVVEGLTLDISGPIDDLKASIVARTLWDNVEIIDDFVRENPARLSEECLQVASSWKYALPGMYTLVRYQGGRGILMGDAGVFSVSGVTDELEGQIGQAPAYVELVLLPFDDMVVYDGFLQAYSPSGAIGELQGIQDEFENRCAQGIVSTAGEFQAVARAYLDLMRDQELDALLADVEREAAHADEVLPEGFHRGVLAGMTADERAVALVSARPEVAAYADEARDGAPLPPDDGLGARAEQALNCVTADVIARGVVAFDEAYDRYRALVVEPLAYEQFVALVEDEASYSDAYFGTWDYDSRAYIVYYSLTPDFVTQQMSRMHGWRELPDELEYYEDYKRGLVAARAEVPAKPLSRTLLENSAAAELMGNPSVRQLRDFFDERVPDGQDDYLFADRLVEDVAFISIETGSLESLFAHLRDMGVDRCTADEERYAALVTNVFNAMPSWENNGWSPQELYEQLTGRKVFYNEDGSIKRVGPDEPCPCGSGLKYRECCGR